MDAHSQELLKDLGIPKFRDLSDEKFLPAQQGARDLLNFLKGADYTSKDLLRIEYAADLMFEAHSEQVRPGGAPYVNHTLLVAKVVAKKFGITDPDVIVASLLHDGPEDQAVRIGELLGNFNIKHAEDSIDIIAQKLGLIQNV